MSEPRTIKKYPNRRLYDTVESRYITLADIRRLVIDRIDFVVMDKKSQEDITRSILLQVIAEQEHGGEPLMSRDFLSQIIRSYGGAMQGMIGSYLEPRLAGATLSISPFLVLFSVFFWAYLWGLSGAFIGVPIVIAALTSAAIFAPHTVKPNVTLHG